MVPCGAGHFFEKNALRLRKIGGDNFGARNLERPDAREGSFPLIDDFVIGGEGLLDHDALVEFGKRPLPCGFSQAPGKRWGVLQPCDRSGERFTVTDWNQEPIYTMRDHFSATRHIRGYQRPRAGRRFNQICGSPSR